MSGAIRPVQKRSFTVAIVEDHRDTRDCMRIYLEEKFFVSAHETALDLLAFVSANHCDVILSDISLPDMDGYELPARIRSNPFLCHLPVITVSAQVTRSDCEWARRAGFDECLAKPVDLEKLLMTIKRHLPEDGATEKWKLDQ